MIITNFTVLASFLLFLIIILLVGLSSFFKKKNNNEDYLLASRSVHPIIVAISGVSSLLSGFMFIGFIGFVYVKGVSAFIYPICWTLGDLTSWFFIHKKLRDKSLEEGSNTINQFIGTSKGVKNYAIIKLSAIITIIFLSAYAAVQLKVGGKALQTFLNFDPNLGIVIAAVITISYCFVGGIRASLWTDVIQSFFMIISMIALLIIGVCKCGGVQSLINQLYSIDPSLISFFPGGFSLATAVYFFSVIVNGFGVIGQPHVMIRPMIIEDSKNLKLARNIYIFWYLLFSFIAVGVGLVARVLLPELSAGDPESAFPILVMKLMPDFFIGLMLAGVFSAALSTADSQIIACNSSITNDIFPKFKNSYVFSKITTIIISVAAVLFAIISKKTVFEMVEMAWSALAVSIGTLLLLKCLDEEVKNIVGCLMMMVSIITVFYWKYFSGADHIIHKTLIGGLVALFIYLLFVVLMSKKKSKI